MRSRNLRRKARRAWQWNWGRAKRGQKEQRRGREGRRARRANRKKREQQPQTRKVHVWRPRKQTDAMNVSRSKDWDIECEGSSGQVGDGGSAVGGGKSGCAGGDRDVGEVARG